MSIPELPENDITKLLRCKRYEQPPPGYFFTFSDRVIARIEADGELGYSSWWSWLVNRFDARPVLICAYSLAVSSLLLVGFRLSQAFEAEFASAPSPGGPWLASGPSSPLLPDMLSHSEVSTIATSLSSAPRTLFREEPGVMAFPASGAHIQPVAFSF